MENNYLIDTNVFRAIENFYPAKFKGFWSQVDGLLREKRFLSVREVKREIDGSGWAPHMLDFFNLNQAIFLTPCNKQLECVARIMKTTYGRQLIRKKQWAGGMPVADPFLIAAGVVLPHAVVVTHEGLQEGAKIPHLCKLHGVESINLEQLMEREGWSF